MPPATSGDTFGVSSSSRQNGGLSRPIAERWWHERKDEIVQSGYELRTRYASRSQLPGPTSGGHFSSSEDRRQPGVVMDAIRIQDGLPVILQEVLPVESPQELTINQFFSSQELLRRSDNHCVPMLGVIELPHVGPHQLMVFPRLLPFRQSRIRTFGEFVGFLTQICEGIQFMHQWGISYGHIMFDPSGRNPNDWFDPSQINRSRNFMGRIIRRFTQTQGHPRYYLAGLEFSQKTTGWNASDPSLTGGDMSIPEGRLDGLNDSFGLDIYCLGNLVSENFVQRYHGFEFVRDLVDAMMDEDPEQRPTIEQVIERLSESLSDINLQSTFVLKDPALSRTTRLLLTLWYNLRRRSSTIVP